MVLYRYSSSNISVKTVNTFIRLCLCAGKKQDLWYVVDLLTGEKQQTLTSSFAEMVCPSSSLLYLGRTGNKASTSSKKCSYVSQSSLQPNPCSVIIIVDKGFDNESLANGILEILILVSSQHTRHRYSI